MPRKLVTILSLDAVGYSALVATDEALTLKRLRRDRDSIIDPIVARHGGRVFKWVGDGCLAEFASAVEALEATQAIAAAARSTEWQPPPLEYRFGLHVGDVVEENGDLMGDGVNVAARLQAAAKPGEILVSDEMRRQVERLTKAQLEPAGDLALKNLPGRYPAFRVSPPHALGKPAATADPRLSIAVLPFQNMSRDPEQEDFCDGVVEEIISRLSRLKWLLVIARNSTFVYKGKSVDIQQVGRELNVRYVLEGSVRKSGQRLRITAQLIDASTGAHVWAERFDGDIGDVFNLQDEVTIAVVSAIEPAMFKAEAQNARVRRPDNLDAWSATMRALGYFVRGTDPAIRSEALSLLHRAIEQAPGYALPKALLSWMTLWDMSRGWLEADAVTLAHARVLADAAIASDDDEAWGHMALGIYLVRIGELQNACSAFEDALARNPSFALARGFLGAAKIYLDKLEEGRRQLLESTRLSPNDPLLPMCYSALSSCAALQGHHEQAIDWAAKAVRLNASYLPGIRNLIVALAAAGESERARAIVPQILALDPTFTVAKYRETGQSGGQLMEFGARWLRIAGVPER